IAELILVVPWPGIATHESRGNPTIVALCLAGLIASRWIESERSPVIDSPGRASEPSSRMKIGSLPVRLGTYPARVGSICSSTEAEARRAGATVPSAVPSTQAVTSTVRSAARRRERVIRWTPVKARRGYRGEGAFTTTSAVAGPRLQEQPRQRVMTEVERPEEVVRLPIALGEARQVEDRLDHPEHAGEVGGRVEDRSRSGPRRDDQGRHPRSEPVDVDVGRRHVVVEAAEVVPHRPEPDVGDRPEYVVVGGRREVVPPRDPVALQEVRQRTDVVAGPPLEPESPLQVPHQGGVLQMQHALHLARGQMTERPGALERVVAVAADRVLAALTLFRALVVDEAVRLRGHQPVVLDRGGAVRGAEEPVGQDEVPGVGPVVRDLVGVVLHVALQAAAPVELVEAVHPAAVDRGDAGHERMGRAGRVVRGATERDTLAVARHPGRGSVRTWEPTEQRVEGAVLLHDEHDVADLAPREADRRRVGRGGVGGGGRGGGGGGARRTAPRWRGGP